MTPLLGTKTPSAPVGDKSDGDGRAARSLLSCALWRGMGRLWRGMGGHRPPHRQHGLSCSPAVGYFFWSEPSLHFSPRGEVKCVRGPSGLGASRAEEKGARRLARAGVLEQYVEHGKQAQRSPGARIVCFDRRVVRNAGQAHQPWFSRNTKHETRITAFMLFTNHSFPTHDFPPFPTISRHFPAPPTPLRRSSVHVSTRRPPFLVSRPDCRAVPRRPVTAFPRAVGRHGAAMARHGRPPSPAPATRPLCFSRDTNHATWFFPVPQATPRRATPSPTNGFFTRHETRDTYHGFFLACFDRRVVGNAG